MRRRIDRRGYGRCRNHGSREIDALDERAKRRETESLVAQRRVRLPVHDAEYFACLRIEDRPPAIAVIAGAGKFEQPVCAAGLERAERERRVVGRRKTAIRRLHDVLRKSHHGKRIAGPWLALRQLDDRTWTDAERKEREVGVVDVAVGDDARLVLYAGDTIEFDVRRRTTTAAAALAADDVCGGEEQRIAGRRLDRERRTDGGRGDERNRLRYTWRCGR